MRCRVHFSGCEHETSEVPSSPTASVHLETTLALVKLTVPTRESARIKEKKDRLASATDLSEEKKYENFLAAYKPAIE